MSSAAAIQEVRIPAGDAVLLGDLSTPQGFASLVVFAHGQGSGRHSARNREVARRLQQEGIATLLLDLLTAQEQQSGQRTPDIAALTQRMQDATAWVEDQKGLRHAALGYFGTGTGAAAALIAAARLGKGISAVVSRGGRLDLAGPAVLSAVKASTLLIAGGADQLAIDINEQAYEHLRCERSLAVVPGAGQLFEEAGALDQVARMAGSWFTTHMAALEAA